MPDFGPAELHPTAGATVIGARFPLIAYNINLNTADAMVAKKIAKAIRYKDGGYRFAKAMGFELKEDKMAQVSINMTNYLGTPLHRIFETVNREAARYGVMIKESEIVGLVPEKALIDAAIYYLQLDRFDEKQILEHHLRSKTGGAESLYGFLTRLSDSTPTPGGGSVAALQGALAAGLLAMVAGITAKKSDDPEVKAGLGFLKMEMAEFYRLIEIDKGAFDAVMKAYKLPKETANDKEVRNRAIQEAYLGAARVPLTVCRRIVGLYTQARILAQKGLKSAVSDVGVAAYSLRSGFLSARINVLINLVQIADETFNRETRSELDRLSAEEEKYHAEVTGICLTNL
jgi:glutamate formiminotransferase/formiminotetrahydrofolate cyclodeaminase